MSKTCSHKGCQQQRMIKPDRTQASIAHYHKSKKGLPLSYIAHMFPTEEASKFCYFHDKVDRGLIKDAKRFTHNARLLF